MRRIFTRHAQSGMVLTRAVYDHLGYQLLESGLELTRKSLITLTKNRVGELFVQDRRLADASVHPAISPFALIIAIADTYFELVSNRPGKPACMPHEAVEFILAGCGELFDPDLTQIFVRLVTVYPAGTAVKLNTGELGIVYNGNSGHIARPVIRICTERWVGVVAKPYDLDLFESWNQARLIVEVDPSMPLDER